MVVELPPTPQSESSICTPAFGEDPQRIGDVRIGVDFLKGLVLLQAKELPELVQRSNLPLPGLLDSENFHVLQDVGNVVCPERARRILCSCVSSHSADTPTGAQTNALLQDFDQVLISK